MVPYDIYQKSAALVKERSGGFAPEAALVLGSGLGGTANLIEDAVIIPYGEIPGFYSATAPGHAGRLILGTLGGRKVAAMQGRMHHYEGRSYEEVVFPIGVFRLLGAKTLIVTNAAGGVNEAFRVGDLMLIRDHISFNLRSPLIGENLPQFGPRFPDMTHIYPEALRHTARKAASELGLTLREGVYFYCTGPQYETPAEIRAVRLLGGDAVGMSTVPEAIAARHCGMNTLGISLITNMAAGILDVLLSEQEVLDAAAEASKRFTALVLRCLEGLGRDEEA